MSTRLLAQKNGNISLIEVHRTTRTYLHFRYSMESIDRKLFLHEQGTKWELFTNTQDAIKWINPFHKPKLLRRIKPESREWFKREKEVQACYAVPIVSCNNCGSPRHKNYCCTYCDKE